MKATLQYLNTELSLKKTKSLICTSCEQMYQQMIIKNINATKGNIEGLGISYSDLRGRPPFTSLNFKTTVDIGKS